MEFATAGSVAHLVKQFGPLPEPAAASLARQLLEALAYCHAAGIAHRDVKGANVLVTHAGVAKLGDFGACKLLPPDSKPSPSSAAAAGGAGSVAPAAPPPAGADGPGGGSWDGPGGPPMDGNSATGVFAPSELASSVDGSVAPLVQREAAIELTPRAASGAPGDGAAAGAAPSASLPWTHAALPCADEASASPTEQGTVQWMAPEVVAGSVRGRQWLAADVWSVGCTVVEMLSGKPLWDDADNAASVMMAIASRDAIKTAKRRLRGRASPRAVAFVAKCLVADLASRPTVADLLRDPFAAKAGIPPSLAGVGPYPASLTPSQSAGSSMLASRVRGVAGTAPGSCASHGSLGTVAGAQQGIHAPPGGRWRDAAHAWLRLLTQAEAEAATACAASAAAAAAAFGPAATAPRAATAAGATTSPGATIQAVSLGVRPLVLLAESLPLPLLLAPAAACEEGSGRIRALLQAVAAAAPVCQLLLSSRPHSAVAAHPLAALAASAAAGMAVPPLPALTPTLGRSASFGGAEGGVGPLVAAGSAHAATDLTEARALAGWHREARRRRMFLLARLLGTPPEARQAMRAAEPHSPDRRRPGSSSRSAGEGTIRRPRTADAAATSSAARLFGSEAPSSGGSPRRAGQSSGSRSARGASPGQFRPRSGNVAAGVAHGHHLALGPARSSLPLLEPPSRLERELSRAEAIQAARALAVHLECAVASLYGSLSRARRLHGHWAVAGAGPQQEGSGRIVLAAAAPGPTGWSADPRSPDEGEAPSAAGSGHGEGEPGSGSAVGAGEGPPDPAGIAAVFGRAAWFARRLLASAGSLALPTSAADSDAHDGPLAVCGGGDAAEALPGSGWDAGCDVTGGAGHGLVDPSLATGPEDWVAPSPGHAAAPSVDRGRGVLDEDSDHDDAASRAAAQAAAASHFGPGGGGPDSSGTAPALPAPPVRPPGAAVIAASALQLVAGGGRPGSAAGSAAGSASAGTPGWASRAGDSVGRAGGFGSSPAGSASSGSDRHGFFASPGRQRGGASGQRGSAGERAATPPRGPRAGARASLAPGGSSTWRDVAPAVAWELALASSWPDAATLAPLLAMAQATDAARERAAEAAARRFAPAPAPASARSLVAALSPASAAAAAAAEEADEAASAATGASVRLLSSARSALLGGASDGLHSSAPLAAAGGDALEALEQVEAATRAAAASAGGPGASGDAGGGASAGASGDGDGVEGDGVEGEAGAAASASRGERTEDVASLRRAGLALLWLERARAHAEARRQAGRWLAEEAGQASAARAGRAWRGAPDAGGEALSAEGARNGRLSGRAADDRAPADSQAGGRGCAAEEEGETPTDVLLDVDHVADLLGAGASAREATGADVVRVCLTRAGTSALARAVLAADGGAAGDVRADVGLAASSCNDGRVLVR